MSIPGGTRRNPDEVVAAILEAVRRANWDALHGPPHLRTGRYQPDPTASRPEPATHVTEPKSQHDASSQDESAT